MNLVALWIAKSAPAQRALQQRRGERPVDGHRARRCPHSAVELGDLDERVARRLHVQQVGALAGRERASVSVVSTLAARYGRQPRARPAGCASTRSRAAGPTTLAPGGSVSSTAEIAAMPEPKATAVPPSSAPIASSNGAQAGEPCSRA